MYPKLMSSEGACICCSLGRLRSADRSQEYAVHAALAAVRASTGFWFKTRAVLQLRAAPCFEEQLHPACNRSTVSTGRGASHSTTCIPGGITREHRGDVLQTSRQWLRQDATEFRTQTNVHGAQDQRGLPLISALRSGSTGDPQTSFGSHKFACQRELAP